MTIPSVLDPTLAPPGCHVVSLFTQFTPFHIEGKEWTDQDKEAYADTGITQLSTTSATIWLGVKVRITLDEHVSVINALVRFCSI